MGTTCALSWQDFRSGRMRLELFLVWTFLSLIYVNGIPPLDAWLLLAFFTIFAWRKRAGWGDVWMAACAGCWVPFAPYCIATGLLGCIIYPYLPQLERGRPFVPILTVALWSLWLLGVGG